MSVCRIVLTNGRKDYLTRTMKSFTRLMSPVDYTVIGDDSQDKEFGDWLDKEFPGAAILHHETKLGMCENIRQLWRAVPAGMEYIQHLEEDFELLKPVDLGEIQWVMAHRPVLGQIWLMRQPWYASEVAVGSVFKHLVLRDGAHGWKGMWVDRGDKILMWTECQEGIFWSHNPCLYRANMLVMRYPTAPLCEDAMARIMFYAGKRSAFWGSPDEDPYTRHIGEISSKVGY